MNMFPEFEEYPIDYILEHMPSLIETTLSEERSHAVVRLSLLTALLQYIRQYEAAKIIIKNLEDDNKKLKLRLEKTEDGGL